ncbi:MAG: GNAT family N-acetyltransferase [Thermomicrobiales bacterium]
MATTEAAPVARGSAGQAFLVGETIYLRAVELGDAKTTPRWRPSPFPIPAEVAEENLKKEIPDQSRDRSQRLIAFRVADDRPVGSVMIETQAFPSVWVYELHADPILGERGGAVRAEIMRLVVPWLLHEREKMAVWVDTVGGDTQVEAAAADLGMRFAYRLREAIWTDGQWHDEVMYEALHPAWIERLGLPKAAVEGAVEREVRHPAPLLLPTPDEPPGTAVMVGERLYLRPLEEDDMAAIARWSLQETETFHEDGRYVRSSIAHWHWTKKLAEDDPPEWVRFGIVLRETDELIGANGIADIDWVNRIAETETEIYRHEHRGGGYGSEAKHLLLTYAFERLGLHSVKSFAWSFNTRSAAALRKQGYRDAGCIHWSGFKDADFAGDVVFDLLASEWRAARR